MGLLSLGTPFDWKDARKHSEHVRDNGLEQLLKMFEAAKDRQDEKFYWGDEVEYTLVKLDPEHHTTQLAIDKDYILKDLGEDGEAFQKSLDNDVSFHPEYGRFMIEATPLKPYDGNVFHDYIYVEENMLRRRVLAKEQIRDESIVPITLTSYPRMGTPNFTFPPVEVAPNPLSKSLYLPDELINRHVRFPTLTANIRRRRGAKVAINVPLYQDTRTRSKSAVDPTIPHRNVFPLEDRELFDGAALPGHIYMDSMGFGMGCSCLQVTMQLSNLDESRFLYDSFLNIAPVMLSLTLALPVYRGFLLDQDVRWNVVSGSVDDRTPFERGVDPLPGHQLHGGLDPLQLLKFQRIPKSRYDSIDQYLGDIKTDGSFGYFREEYNDLPPVLNQKVYQKLVENGFDTVLARHFAHLYIRDPIVIFSEILKQDNDKDNDHFENIQSTNWQTLRFKPPSQSATPDNKSAIGWRVEFRPMEISITDFENALFGCFIPLLAKAILKYRPNLYIPLTCIEKNMKVAHKRDSAVNSTFYFRKNIQSLDTNSILELSLNQIFNGSEEFIGLIPLVEKVISEEFARASAADLHKMKLYLKLISCRANGSIPTTAKFIRNFILTHPSYQKDSVVSEEISFDLISKLVDVTDYKHELLKEFFGDDLAGEMIALGYGGDEPSE